MSLPKALFLATLGILRTSAFPMYIFRAYVAGLMGCLAMISLLVGNIWGSLFFVIVSAAIVASVFWEHYSTKEPEQPRV